MMEDVIDFGNKSEEEEIDDVLGSFGEEEVDELWEEVHMMEDFDVTGEVIGIISKAGQLSLNVLAVLELAYDKIKKCYSAYSVEATSASLAVIKFYTTKKICLGQKLLRFTLCCK